MQESELSLIENPTLETEEILDWHNDDNNAFYEALKAEGLRKFAEKAGLATCCDMDVIKHYLHKAHNILDVGSGYGRIIKYLLDNFNGNITGTEQCTSLYNNLVNTFRNYSNVNIIHSDINKLSDTDHSFDIITMMWSTIGDFAHNEQPFLIKKLKSLLASEGIIIIDTLSIDALPLEAKTLGKQLYVLKANKLPKYIYEPGQDDIELYAKEVMLSNIKRLDYQTTTQRPRCLFILS